MGNADKFSKHLNLTKFYKMSAALTFPIFKRNEFSSIEIPGNSLQLVAISEFCWDFLTS